MKEILEILLFGLFGLWLVLIPMNIIMKIKYLKMMRRKEYYGISELVMFLSPEWWIAGLIFYLPILIKDEHPGLNIIKKKANKRLIWFWGIIAIQISIVGLLNMI